MKQTFKTIGVLQILLLYGFVMLLNSDPALCADIHKTANGPTQHSEFNKELGANGLLHISRNENIINYANSLTPTCVKVFTGQIINDLHKQDQTTIHCFTSYHFFF